jgi:hypothetical protein
MNPHAYIGKIILSQNSPLGAASLLATFSLIIALFSLGYTIYSGRRRERRAYLDEFWFRQIIAPSCVDPTLVLRKKWNPQLQGLVNKKLTKANCQNLTRQLQDEIDAAIDSAWVASLFEGDLYEGVERALESINDDIAKTISLASLNDKVLSVDVVSDLCNGLSKNCMSVLQCAVKANASKLDVR